MAYIKGSHEIMMRARENRPSPSSEQQDFYDTHFGPVGLNHEELLECKNFREAFTRRTKKAPDSPAIIWVDKSCEEVSRRSYRQLLNSAQHIAKRMFSKFHLNAGDKVALCFLPGIDFIPAMLACLLTGFFFFQSF